MEPWWSRGDGRVDPIQEFCDDPGFGSECPGQREGTQKFRLAGDVLIPLIHRRRKKIGNFMKNNIVDKTHEHIIRPNQVLGVEPLTYTCFVLDQMHVG